MTQLRWIGNKRQGFTLIELLIVIAIIGVLIGLLAAAVGKAREAAARAQCASNLRQLGVAIQHFYDSYNHFPDAGEGSLYKDPSGVYSYIMRDGNPPRRAGQEPTPTPPVSWFFPNGVDNSGIAGTQINGVPRSLTLGSPPFNCQSVFTRLLPYLEKDDVIAGYNMRYPYNDTAAPDNQAIAQSPIAAFLCPSNPLRPSNGLDGAGYGYTDYGPTVATDIDPVSGVRNKNTRLNGALHGTPDGLGTTHSDIADGLHTTIAIAEDVGRNDTMPGSYKDPVTGNARCFWRWAEPDNGFVVSGDPVATTDGLGTQAVSGQRAQVINNNKSPFGGSRSRCLWANTTNCGPNDEIFSFHGDGANVLFMDGHVTYINENVDAIVMRRLVTAAEHIEPTVTSPGAPINANAADY
jgi:prepilin-type N-terminal cleavage/methylation domain-containing protein/prepilin-type processing-associated H-X9-DG protein